MDAVSTELQPNDVVSFGECIPETQTVSGNDSLLRFKPARSHLISDITAIGLDFALAYLYGTSVEDQRGVVCMHQAQRASSKN